MDKHAHVFYFVGLRRKRTGKGMPLVWSIPSELRRTMKNHPWVRELPVAITVVNAEGIILEMNNKSVETFGADGGEALIGKNALECHPEPSRTKLARLLEAPQANIYTIEKGGRRKMICQIPWFRSRKFAGIVELSIEIPDDVPHFVRA